MTYSLPIGLLRALTENPMPASRQAWLFLMSGIKK